MPSVEFSDNAMAIPRELVAALRVDRDVEVEQCRHTLLDNGQHVYLYGERGTGKTFLLRLVRPLLTANASTLVVDRRNAQPLRSRLIGQDTAPRRRWVS